MKKFIFLLMAILMSTGTLFAQGVSINNDGADPDGSAMLDIKSTTMGVLVPRLSQAQRDAITTPATGLIVFQTDNTPGFYYYNGSNWVVLNAQAMSVNDLIDGKTGGGSLWFSLHRKLTGAAGTGHLQVLLVLPESAALVLWQTGNHAQNHFIVAAALVKEQDFFKRLQLCLCGKLKAA